MATKHIAAWVYALNFTDLPEGVIKAALRSFYNWVGCAVGGSDHEATKIAYKALEPFMGPPTASVLGHRGALRTDPQHAALLNGIASHVHDYDDTHLDTIIHPTGPVASALLAAAEWATSNHGKIFSGRDFLTALTAGIEVECKVGLGVWPEHYDLGWHITSTVGSMGAAVAVAKLFSLSEIQLAHAIGIAATQVTGLREMFGTHTKSFHPGRAAQNGLIAALLAKEGYTSSEEALEAKRGWAHIVGATKDDIQGSLAKWVGSGDSQVGLPILGANDFRPTARGRWEILRNTFKPFPCGIVVHPIIDACTQLHAEIHLRRLSLEDIDSCHIRVHPLVLELTGKKAPKDGLQAKFSVYHGAACGLIFGKATPSQYEDAVVRDSRVVDIRDRVRVEVDKSLAADEAVVVLRMKTGEEFGKHVFHSVGSLEDPLDDKRLEEKFLDQCESVLGPQGSKRASDELWALTANTDISSVTKTL